MTEASPADHRVSDAERQDVVDRLRDETTAGRLTLDEFDERLTEVYAARTRADLEHSLRELPVSLPDPLMATASMPASATPARTPIGGLSPELEARARRQFRMKLRNDLSGFVVANGTCMTIWAMTGADGHFWPAWVIMGTGIGLVKRIIGGVDQEREVVEGEWKREQRRLEKKRAAAAAAGVGKSAEKAADKAGKAGKKSADKAAKGNGVS